jgi:lipoprotein-anchoring transpeptidase ErfK/SrfK
MVQWCRRSLLLALALGLVVVATGVGGRGWSKERAPALSIVVKLAERRLHVYEHGRLIHTYVVSVGMPKHRTPRGAYHITHVVWNPWWIPPKVPWARGKGPTPPGPKNPMGRVKMYFAPEYYIHGTPEEATLGEPVSHGCIRMYERDAIALARLVLRRGKPGVSEATIDKILAHPRMTETMMLAHPIPLEVR